MTLNLTPLGNRIVVKRDESSNVTKGGIVLPDGAKERPSRGKVLSVGPGRMVDGQLQAMNVKAGDLVLFGKYAGNDVTLGDVEVVIMNEEDVLGTLS